MDALAMQRPEKNALIKATVISGETMLRAHAPGGKKTRKAGNGLLRPKRKRPREPALFKGNGPRGRDLGTTNRAVSK